MTSHPNRLLLAFACCAGFGGVSSAAVADDSAQVELQAKTWFNPASIRIPDDRTYVLFFFTALQEREVKPYIANLNKLHRTRGHVVVGLSAEPETRVAKFVEREKIRFTVGAGSRTYKEFKIERFPSVVVLHPEENGEDLEDAILDARSFGRWLEEVVWDEPMESGAFDDRSTLDALKRHAHTDSNYQERKRAIGILREQLPAEEFMEFCDEVLDHESHPLQRGFVSYQKHLVDPNVLVKEPLLAGSTLARREMLDSPNDPKWDRLHEYFEGIEDRSTEQLYEEYLEHLGDDPVNLQIRKGLPRELNRRCREELLERAVAVDYLKQLLPKETDWATRLRMVGAFGEICRPGDFDVADFLEEQLETETNIRLVRPMMEYTIRYLRTGEE